MPVVSSTIGMRASYSSACLLAAVPLVLGVTLAGCTIKNPMQGVGGSSESGGEDSSSGAAGETSLGSGAAGKASTGGGKAQGGGNSAEAGAAGSGDIDRAGAGGAGGQGDDSSSRGGGAVVSVPDGPCVTSSGEASAGAVGDESGDLCGVAADLMGLRWELPCTGDKSGMNCVCPLSVVKTATLHGPVGLTYAVTLHFRGVVEAKTYVGGRPGAEGLSNSNLFNVGGTPDDGFYNIYELDVSAPKQTFYLNAGTSGSIDVLLIDYVATIKMQAGATVTLIGNSIESRENNNVSDAGVPVIPAGVPPAPLAYDGQFVQMDVESVRAE